jgi:hypothetical protein
VNIDFNTWRARYDTMTFAEHQAFNQQVADRYPEQQSWDAAACEAFLRTHRPRLVAEVGGWDGALAARMLERLDDIDRWVNYDITDVPQVCVDRRYVRCLLERWPWQHTITADALVLSHVAEHMRATQLAALLKRWRVHHVYLDVPVEAAPPNWHGYSGTHILEVGRDGLQALAEQAGYTVSYQAGTVLHLDAAAVPA